MRGRGRRRSTRLKFLPKKNSSDVHMRYEGAYFSFAAVDNDEAVCSIGQS